MATFLEKEQKILQALVDTDYAIFDGDKNDALTTISESLDSFSDYANIVIHEQNHMPILRVQLQGQDYRDAVQTLDQRRRSAHDSAIVGMGIMNRISQSLNLEPFAVVNTEDRQAVADCIGNYINEVYNHGIGKTFDDATMNKTISYDKNAQTRLQQAVDKLGSAVSAEPEQDSIHHDFQ